MPARIILIRHGQTDWNIQMRYQGSKDMPLNATGMSQASLLGSRMKKEKVKKVYASTMKRANDFASIVFSQTAIEPVPGLREISFGIFEGMTYDEIMHKHPDIYSKWIKDPLNLTVPEGEDPKLFKRRVLESFDRIAKTAASDGKDGYTAVVAHGGPISVIVNKIKGIDSFWDNIPNTGSITIIEDEGGERRIKSFNDTSHLTGE